MFTSLPMRHTSLLAAPNSRASRDRVHNSLSHLFEKVKLMTENDNEIFSDNMAMAIESREDETPDDQTTKLVLHRYRNAYTHVSPSSGVATSVTLRPFSVCRPICCE